MPNKQTVDELYLLTVNNKYEELQSLCETRLKKKDKIISAVTSDVIDPVSGTVDNALLAAVRHGDGKILKYFISQGVDVNSTLEAKPPSPCKLKTPLHLSVKLALISTVETLLDENADVNKRDHKNRTALHLAVASADYDITRMLLYRGANVKTLDNEGRTALQVLSVYGHAELAKLMLQFNASVFQEGQRGPSPIHIAAKEGHVPLLNLFCEHVDVNIKCACPPSNEEKAPLHIAAKRGLVETVQLLVEKFNADRDVLDTHGNTPLHCCVMFPHDHRRMRTKDNYVYIVDILLRNAASVDVKNGQGCTALHLAASNQHHRIVELLLITGADPNMRNIKGKSPQEVIKEYDAPMKQIFTSFFASPERFSLRRQVIDQIRPSTPIFKHAYIFRSLDDFHGTRDYRFKVSPDGTTLASASKSEALFLQEDTAFSDTNNCNICTHRDSSIDRTNSSHSRYYQRVLPSAPTNSSYHDHHQ